MCARTSPNPHTVNSKVIKLLKNIQVHLIRILSSKQSFLLTNVKVFTRPNQQHRDIFSSTWWQNRVNSIGQHNGPIYLVITFTKLWGFEIFQALFSEPVNKVQSSHISSAFHNTSCFKLHLFWNSPWSLEFNVLCLHCFVGCRTMRRPNTKLTST